MKTDCCYFDLIYLCVKMDLSPAVISLISSPSTGEDKGEGA
jgi:hypothetical protein